MAASAVIKCMDCGVKRTFIRAASDDELVAGVQGLLDAPAEECRAGRCSACERMGEEARLRRLKAVELLEAKALVAMAELDKMEERGEPYPPPPPPTAWEGTEGYAKRWVEPGQEVV